MNAFQKTGEKMTNYRWTICAMLFLQQQLIISTARCYRWPGTNLSNRNSIGMKYTTVLSLPYSLLYMQYVCCLPVASSTGWAPKRYLWAIGVWSAGACMHALCGIVTEQYVGLHSAAELMAATGDVVVVLATVSMYCFLAARCILALGEAGNFPAAIKVTAEYFPKGPRLRYFYL